MTARRPSPIRQGLASENASLRAELALAQQRTRDIEKARQSLEVDLGAALYLRNTVRATAASNIVTLARNLGVDHAVLEVLGALHGWRSPDDLARDDEYEECDDD